MNAELGAIDSVMALKRIRGAILETPLVLSQSLSEKLGFQVFLKCENLQYMNAFKIRGAENFMSSMTTEELQRGVVAFSSGNHAQGVALAAARRQISATIVMPKDAPPIKIARTRELGATVVLYDRLTESREAIASQIAMAKNSVLIPAFDHPWIIEGQGTMGVELLQQLPQIGTVVVSMSGGGLASGLGVAIHALSPGTKIVGIEPQVGNDIQLSFIAGKVISVPQPKSIADGLLSPQPGKITFPILKAHLDRVETVTDDQILRAVRILAMHEKLVVEPSGAAAFAWLLHSHVKLPGPVVVILTGGNIEPMLLERALKTTV